MLGVFSYFSSSTRGQGNHSDLLAGSEGPYYHEYSLRASSPTRKQDWKVGPMTADYGMTLLFEREKPTRYLIGLIRAKTEEACLLGDI
ncbi:hypothetical protein N7522_011528 [Penicillium canescens]|uniref:Uncharacterized protein n=1 Tax=Penicillium canescens TaxID=5083 RepID=A0AAD6ILB9_PENCN|nr:uncharacterized protein N7446_007250 [Penicillium canescens]KAJ5991321.1 hypothetical protein N7522_011528 [Penicillium canescens]KAJ6049419.1 hypothetical protein N7444_006135 [Penicillium canescens]KAJ6052611.1 hypothetical protein N7460_003145 [Penicillium canescens]KAJ6063130.1 hypothetical protein N7446_007250 [Penicillium canescens]